LPWILAGVLLTALAVGPLPAQAAPGPSAPPSCAEGPERIGDTIEGTPCADTIVVPAGVASVSGGGGNDTIMPGPISAVVTSCPAAGCRLDVGSQTFEGGPGNDIVFGERGNDTLLGGGGNDKLFGGPGDDLVRGGTGDDLLIGGFGADTVDGEEGNDYIRGDATIDHLRDSGPSTDVDTLSYSTGVTPGFSNREGYPDFSGQHSGFPEFSAGRGVYLNLAAAPEEENGDNAGATNGGGVDEVEGADFERIVGSPFSDYIVGTSATQEIFGGGGADVLIAGSPATKLNGDAEGDDCVGGVPAADCESTASNGPVVTRDATKVAVGSMTEGAGGYAELYLLGSSGNDGLTVDSTGGAMGEAVTMHLTGGSSFQAPPVASGCVLQNSATAVCTLQGPLASLLVAGLGGADNLRAAGLPGPTSLMMLGGEGNDEISSGNESDDILVDGPGDDTLHGHSGDDVLTGNAGQDTLQGEDGNDLFLSNTICEGDTIEGGNGRDNASWAKFDEGVGANLALGQAGRPNPATGVPTCPGGTLDSLPGIEDLEGSGSADTFYGDGGANQLLGHAGADTYRSGSGEDLILANAANSEGSDVDAAIDCGADTDTAIVDLAKFGGDPPPVECESVVEAAGDNFNLPPPEIPPPPLEPNPEPPKKRVDTKPPRTRLAVHPPKRLVTRSGHRRVVFRFASSEAGSRFICRIDGRPFRTCTSPRAYVLGPGRHTFRVVAADQAGNVDRTPALFHFQIKRR
jgi:Ca2+-binding RTX toxin-like protein